MNAVLRRASGGLAPTSPTTLTAGTIELDVVVHEARRDGQVLALTAKEFDLLAYFMAHPRRAFRRDELLEHVWGWTYGDTATVTVHVRRLREKVEADPSRPVHLCTVRGVGYRFEP